MSLEAETSTLDAPAVVDAAVTSAPPIAAKEPTTSEAPAETSLDDDLRAVFRNVNKPRADDGRFTPKDGAAPVDPAAEVVAEPEKTTPLVPAVAPPRSWPKEMAEKFGTLPPEVQTYVNQREIESHKAISTLGQQVKQYEPVARVLQENRATFERNGTTYEAGVAALVAAQNALDQNPENGLAFLAKTYGVDLRNLVTKIYGPQGAETDHNGLAPDPEIVSLRSELAQLKQQIEYSASQQTSREKAAIEAKQNNERDSLQTRISKFAEGKADFDQVAPEILANMTALQQSDPGLSPDELLQQAYERAIWANPKTRAAQIKSEEARRLQEAAKAAAESKRAGSINVRGAPKPTAEAGDIDSDLRSVWRKNNAR